MGGIGRFWAILGTLSCPPTSILLLTKFTRAGGWASFSLFHLFGGGVLLSWPMAHPLNSGVWGRELQDNSVYEMDSPVTEGYIHQSFHFTLTEPPLHPLPLLPSSWLSKCLHPPHLGLSPASHFPGLALVEGRIFKSDSFFGVGIHVT
jgi:hypothetical protein